MVVSIAVVGFAAGLLVAVGDSAWLRRAWLV
jgi:hypothetical protein